MPCPVTFDQNLSVLTLVLEISVLEDALKI